MPLPLLPLIGIGAGLLEGVGNLFSQKSTNDQAQANMMQQRSWAVEDWNKQNAYNAPAAQMERFKAAGLNPNLIYGQTNTAAPVRSSDTARLQAPQLNVASSMLQGFMSMYDLQKTQAQTDQLKAQVELIKANTRLSATKEDQTYLQNRALDTKLDYYPEMLKLQNQKLAADITKKGADTEFTIAQNERNKVLTAQSLTLGVERILQTRLQNAKLGVEKMMLQQQIQNLQQDSRIKNFEENLNKYGFTRSDDVKIRLAAKILQMTQE